MSADFADRDRVNYDVESIEREYDAMLKPQPEQRAPTIVTEHVFVGSTRCEIHDTTVPHCEYCGHRFVGRAHECAEMRAWNAPARAPMPDDTPDAPAAREDANDGIALAILAATKNVDALYEAAKTLQDRAIAAEARAVRAEGDVTRLNWLQSEHDRVDPVAALVVKQLYQRDSNQWANVAGDVRAAIDAALAADRP